MDVAFQVLWQQRDTQHGAFMVRERFENSSILEILISRDINYRIERVNSEVQGRGRDGARN